MTYQFKTKNNYVKFRYISNDYINFYEDIYYKRSLFFKNKNSRIIDFIEKTKYDVYINCTFFASKDENFDIVDNNIQYCLFRHDTTISIVFHDSKKLAEFKLLYGIEMDQYEIV